ncbi:hypothetical protein P8452_28851 [Trifolium repens]|nr:hypothetical protein P8452_28851 [Trifolium repens]
MGLDDGFGVDTNDEPSGHNASSCKSTVQDPNGLKRKRKPPKGKVHAEAKPGADPKSDANPSKEPIPEANPSQAQKPAPVEADQNPISATVEVSQVENPTQNSATVQVDQGLFDEIPDEIMATIADITMAEAPKQGKVKAEKGKVKPVKLYHGKKMRHDEERKKMKQYEEKYLEEDEESIALNSVEEEANGLGKN